MSPDAFYEAFLSILEVHGYVAVPAGDLIKILWHDGLGLSLYAKRLERGRFVWPSAEGGSVAITAAQLAYMLDGIDWRNPVHTFRPERAG